jgi:hypothetical protein
MNYKICLFIINVERVMNQTHKNIEIIFNIKSLR